jgi:hypothetical protein
LRHKRPFATQRYVWRADIRCAGHERRDEQYREWGGLLSATRSWVETQVDVKTPRSILLYLSYYDLVMALKYCRPRNGTQLLIFHDGR